MAERADPFVWEQRRRCLRQDVIAKCFYPWVSSILRHDATSIVFCSTRHRYFPTVYEPTVFENYVHGTTFPRIGHIRWSWC
jgi:hypothetical protein